jgi:hypothetical protein
MTMPEPLANVGLLKRGLSLLERQLGPVQTLEFMAMVSRQPFDYQRWREEEFGGLSIDDILARAKEPER